MPELIRHTSDPDRARANTAPEINTQLDQLAAMRLRDYASQSPLSLEARMSELDREWDIERVIEAESATMALVGLLLTWRVSRSFVVLPGVVASMVLLHAVQGWYPLLPIFRRLGIRTQDEIQRERFAVKAIRGDFSAVQPDGEAVERAAAAWNAVLM